MKTKILITSLFGLSLHLITYCDIISPNTHSVNYCPKITNLESYPEISLIGYVLDGGGFNYCYLINDTICLEKGPNQLSGFVICAISNYYMEYIKYEIDNIDWQNNKNAYLSTVIQPNPRYRVDNSNPLHSKDSYYKIMGFTDSALVLFKWKEVFGFSNGSPDSIIIYQYSGDSTKLSQHVRSFIFLPNGIDLNLREYETTVYPNPSNGIININLSCSYIGEITFQIFNRDGVLVETFSANKTAKSLIFDIPTKNLNKGVYFLKTSYQAISETKKIIID